MKLVVGLGNPGEKYAKSRHNVGFAVIDRLVKGLVATPQVDKRSESIIFKLGNEAILQKPQTFMNVSGKAVASLSEYYKIEPKDIMVVHDEVDLPFGEIKHQFDRGAAGHNGVESVIKALGTQEFNRLRVGVGRPSVLSFDVHDWVLDKFTEDEDDVEHLVERAVEVVENWLRTN
jgi:PTH1 family peptidyl-tRNA hydrolase